MTPSAFGFSIIFPQAGLDLPRRSNIIHRSHAGQRPYIHAMQMYTVSQKAKQFSLTYFERNFVCRP